MKKWLALALACVMMIGTLIIVPISANEGTASVTVLDKNNLAINLATNELYLQYAVDATVPSGATLEVGLYSDAEATTKIATAVASGETIEGTNYEIYNTPAINMINIDVTFYAKAVITNGDEVLASSDVVACSVEDYMTRRAEAADVTEVETNLFAAIRAYAAAAKAFKDAMTPVEPEPPVDPEPEVPTAPTIADILAGDPDVAVTITGTVSGIYQEYNPSYGNVSVYITDETGTILAFRMDATSATDYVVGDVITVTGTTTLYNETIQIAQGCTAEMVTRHTCNYKDATCTAPKTCESCGATVGEARGHTEPNAEGKCDTCGENLTVATEDSTMAITAAGGALASDKSNISWANDVFTLVNAKNNSSTAIRTSDSNHFRCYQGSAFNVNTNNGQAITKITITVTESKYVTPLINSATNAGYSATANGTTVTIVVDNATSVSFEATAQWRLSSITVTYVA